MFSSAFDMCGVSLRLLSIAYTTTMLTLRWRVCFLIRILICRRWNPKCIWVGLHGTTFDLTVNIGLVRCQHSLQPDSEEEEQGWVWQVFSNPSLAFAQAGMFRSTLGHSELSCLVSFWPKSWGITVGNEKSHPCLGHSISHGFIAMFMVLAESWSSSGL